MNIQKLKPSKDFKTIRHRFLQKVQAIINEAFGTSAGLQVRLFGSSCNGLGTHKFDGYLPSLQAKFHDEEVRLCEKEKRSAKRYEVLDDEAYRFISDLKKTDKERMAYNGGKRINVLDGIDIDAVDVVSGPAGMPNSHAKCVPRDPGFHTTNYSTSTHWDVSFEDESCSSGYVQEKIDGDWEKSTDDLRRVVSVRKGSVLSNLTEDLLNIPNRRSCYLVVVEDPFQLDRNVAATLFSHDRLRDECQRAVLGIMFGAAIFRDTRGFMMVLDCPSNSVMSGRGELRPKLPKRFIESALQGSVGRLIGKLKPSDHFDGIRHRFLKKVQAIINEAFGKSAGLKVRLFGSSCNGLGTDNADVDITIVLPPSANINRHPCNNMLLLHDIFERAGMEDISHVLNATVPICKFYDPEFKLTADINAHNLLGLENTKLIHTYLRMDPRLEIVIRLVKYWAQRKGLNDSGNAVREERGLSSYAYVLMVINFFQVKGYLPSLQDIFHDEDEARLCRKKKKLNKKFDDLDDEAYDFMHKLKKKDKERRANNNGKRVDVLDGIDIDDVHVVSGPEGMPEGHAKYTARELFSHETNYSTKKCWDVSFEDESCLCGYIKGIIKDSQEKSIEETEKGAVQLFYEVMTYYGWEYEYSKKRVVSVRVGDVLESLTDDLLDAPKRRKCYLVVEDPFQTLRPSKDFDGIRHRFLQKIQGIINTAFAPFGEVLKFDCLDLHEWTWNERLGC
ncbi:hypothetical protein HDU76_013304 [Blyttiomyces sp. JEL0837]|nr:hypothetical protein HDU76_013304 [Blyttiomyces sp. JEL0837]